jgi:hypothetical protein
MTGQDSSDWLGGRQMRELGRGCLVHVAGSHAQRRTAVVPSRRIVMPRDIADAILFACQ